MNIFTRKKVFGEDEDNVLTFKIKKAQANTVVKLEKLCETNPNKCSQIKPELCDKMFAINGYNKIPPNSCKMYINIVNILNMDNKNKRLVNTDIKPCKELFLLVSRFGDKTTIEFFVSCGYVLESSSRTLTNSSISLDETPTVIISRR